MNALSSRVFRCNFHHAKASNASTNIGRVMRFNGHQKQIPSASDRASAAQSIRSMEAFARTVQQKLSVLSVPRGDKRSMKALDAQDTAGNDILGSWRELTQCYIVVGEYRRLGRWNPMQSGGPS